MFQPLKYYLRISALKNKATTFDATNQIKGGIFDKVKQLQLLNELNVFDVEWV